MFFFSTQQIGLTSSAAFGVNLFTGRHCASDLYLLSWIIKKLSWDCGTGLQWRVTSRTCNKPT